VAGAPLLAGGVLGPTPALKALVPA
jgi:hypothetical protein